MNEVCSLHIHNRFSASRGVPIPMGPLSVGNAVGIMIAHGNAGTALTRRTDVWMTRDGGYSWYKVGTANLCLTSLSESRLTSRAVFMMLKRVVKDEARRGVAACDEIGYLTIIPRARMGYESIAHEAEGRMGY